MRNALAYMLAVVALVLNPFFACDQPPEYQYGLKEIEAAIAGSWRMTDDATGQSVTFRMEAASATRQLGSRGLINSAAACGSRTLVKSAHACADTTAVPLRFVVLDGSTLRLTGKLIVPSRYFDIAMLQLYIDDRFVGAVIEPNGHVKSADTKLVHTK